MDPSFWCLIISRDFTSEPSSRLVRSLCDEAVFMSDPQLVLDPSLCSLIISRSFIWDAVADCNPCPRLCPMTEFICNLLKNKEKRKKKKTFDKQLFLDAHRSREYCNINLSPLRKKLRHNYPLLFVYVPLSVFIKAVHIAGHAMVQQLLHSSTDTSGGWAYDPFWRLRIFS